MAWLQAAASGNSKSGGQQADPGDHADGAEENNDASDSGMGSPSDLRVGERVHGVISDRHSCKRYGVDRKLRTYAR